MDRKDTIYEKKEIVYGKNVVDALLKSDKKVDEVYLLRSSRTLDHYSKICKEKGIKFSIKSGSDLDKIRLGAVLQGVLARVDKYEYCEVSDILKEAETRGEKPFIIILDKIVDMHNLGAIIRTAYLAGAHGVIIKKDGAAGVNPTVYNTSVGAAFFMKIARVTNISRTIDELKKSGVWAYASDMGGSPMYDFDFKDGTALVIGNEGKGVSELVKKNSDAIVSIPIRESCVDSLNASVAASVLMYEVLRQRY